MASFDFEPVDRGEVPPVVQETVETVREITVSDEDALYMLAYALVEREREVADQEAQRLLAEQEKAELHRQVREGGRNKVTGLEGFGAFVEDVTHRYVESPSQQGFIAFLDLNGLKLVNDVYDHGTGNLYLRAAGRALSAALREGDTLYHIHGDEFIIFSDKDYDDDQIEEYMSDIDSIMDKNESEALEEVFGVKLQAASGHAYLRDHYGYESLMNEADANMQKDKDKKKPKTRVVADVPVLGNPASRFGRLKLTYHPPGKR